jgi:DNA-binding CsgD family transcriptional regulator
MNLGALGFLELSLGNDADALTYLRPLLDWIAQKGLALAPHPMAPNVLEALVAAGELDEARELLARFEREAHALESPWALAIGARSRALLLAAEGDLGSALTALESALALDEHGRWPFERARTLFVLGRTLRRAKQKSAAKQSLEQAIALFDGLPAPLWSERGREELRRIGLRRAASGQLTESERRVAELAASGLTNREVAAKLFMSPKTVEANLARAYRKLGIHSRAELGARLANAGREPVQT